MIITAEALSLQDLFRKGVFEPARVQRDYQWTDNEWRDLLVDLEGALRKAGRDPDPDEIETASGNDVAETAEEDDGLEGPPPLHAARLLDAAQSASQPKHYFLGPMVLLPRPLAKDAYYIFDGQQRFTTLSILLSALRDQLGEASDDWLELQELLRTSDERRSPRLKVDTRGGALARIIGNLNGARYHAATAARSRADRLMYGAADYFYRNTKSWSDDKRRAFVQFLRENVFVAATFISDRKLAELAYQTVNTRGRSLGSGDIIKGHLVQVVGAVSSQSANEVAAVWDRLKAQAGGHFENFLRAVDFIMFGRHRDNDFGEQIMERCDEPDGAAFAHAWVTQELPRHWKNFEPLLAHERAAAATGVDIPLRQLSFLSWREWQGVAMEFFNAYAHDERKLTKAMTQLQRACYLMHLLKWTDRPTSRARALSNAISELHDGLSPFRSPTAKGRGALFFSDDHKAQARGALLTPMPEDSFHGPVVRYIETLHWSENLPRQATDDRSVEHVLPRTHSEAWLLALPDEAEREAHKNLLGNFCLLPRNVDRDLGNSGFDIKRERFLTLDKEHHRSAHEVASYKEWTAAAIEERTAKLADRVARKLGIMPRPKPTPAPPQPPTA